MSDSNQRTPLLSASETYSEGLSNPQFTVPDTPFISTPNTLPSMDPNNSGTLGTPYSVFPGIGNIFNMVNPQIQLPPFNLVYVEYPEKLFKVQRRTSGFSQQRVKSGNISFILDFHSAQQRDLVANSSIKVKRTNETDNIIKRVGAVPVEARFEPVQESKYLVTLDLDSIYEYKGKKVYELERSLTDELNMFHLIVQVEYSNGQIVSQNTKNIQMIGRETKQRPKPSKRPHAESTGSSGSYDSLLHLNSPDSLLTLPYSPADDTGLINARSVVADHIKTKTLDVDGLVFGKMQTAQGDIAYHHKKQDPQAVFEEGEIGALVPDEDDEKKHVIAKMNEKNLPNVVLAGVVTRSQYFEAHVPEPGVASETICMMGVVPVQVRGSVAANEALYASVDNPGLAISGHHLDISAIKDSIFIGYAFSSRKTDDEDSVGFVSAGVSVLETAGKYMLNQRLRDVEESVDVKIDNIQKSRRRSRKCVIICGLMTTALVILLSCFLWQILMPGSAYRYYICKLGRKTNPKGSAFYNFIPYSDRSSYPRVNGIEFTFEKLRKKSHHPDYKQLNLAAFNITGVRYYLNIDRCAYGGLRETGDRITGRKRVYGADVFAVDDMCYNAYYYNENKSSWIKYNSVSWKKFRNLYCSPSPPRQPTVTEDNSVDQ